MRTTIGEFLPDQLKAIGITEISTWVSPMNVGEEFDRALHTCLREKRPVHIQIPSDITHLEIEVDDAPFSTARPPPPRSA
ncbi:hypothetical protein ACUY2E_06245 [Corynebacterium confusum]|uniref:hypothetical protein n=1 Tax=uncultured Corynebacterium sp. TaxID=159447 RepID=UPI0025EA3805|nr:hypothetical protein [uncultured Corynebacterium sp.]